jgi:hypothetical protein
VDLVAQQYSDVCECVTAQMFVAVLLLVNFLVNVAETEISDMDTEMRKQFDIVDNCFTIFYVLELLLNLFVNWFWPFVTNGWSIFDSFAVATSVAGALITLASKDAKNNLSVIRSIRMYVAPFELLPHSAPCTSSLDCDSPPDDLRTCIPVMYAYLSVCPLLSDDVHELMLYSRDFLVCAPARVFAPPALVCFSVFAYLSVYIVSRFSRLFEFFPA